MNAAQHLEKILEENNMVLSITTQTARVEGGSVLFNPQIRVDYKQQAMPEKAASKKPTKK